MTRSLGLDASRVAAASAAWVWVPDSATTVETADWLLIRYPAHFTRPLVARLHGAAAGPMLDRLVEAASGNGGDRLQVWLAPTAADEAAELLFQRGAVVDESVDVLALDLASPLPAVPLDDALGVELRWVRSLAEARQAERVEIEVFGGSPASDEELLRDLPDAASVLTRASGRLLALLAGQPVATAGLTVVDGVARLWGGGVVESARGRGVYRALVAERLQQAVKAGADLALVKGRIESSGPILRRLGFSRFGQETAYLLFVGPALSGTSR